MKIVLMGIAVILKENKILLRKTDPEKNPYNEPWALFGGRLDGDGSVEDLINKDFMTRWNMQVKIVEKTFWDEEQKTDHDGELKRFIYLDMTCELINNSNPKSENPNEDLQWVDLTRLSEYDVNPPTKILLEKMRLL